MRKLASMFVLCSVFLLLIFLFQYQKFEDGKLHLVVCNVGQGDAIFIRSPKGTDILIDGGPDNSVSLCLGRHMPFWDRSIEAIILTHPHADHLTGFIDVLERYQVLSFYTEKVEGNTKIYHLLQDRLAEKKVSASNLQTDDEFLDPSGFSLKTLWPSPDVTKTIDHTESNLDVNGLSVIQLLSYGNFHALLTGDAGKIVEDQIAGIAGDIDVLKVPHHGSSTGMSESFLSVVKPELAVISVGAKNRYGHPSKISLDLLLRLGVTTLRTDRNGEVEIITDGETWVTKAARESKQTFSKFP